MLAKHLKKILTAKTLVKPKTNNNILLQEENVMDVEVADIPPELTTVDMRQIGCLSGLKSGNWKKICDYLLVFNQGNKDCAIFVELKNRLYEDKTDGMEQLRRSLPFLEYLCSVSEIQYRSTNRVPSLRIKPITVQIFRCCR